MGSADHSQVIYLKYKYRLKGESDAEISLNKVLQG
jgi:hypothetical protein